MMDVSAAMTQTASDSWNDSTTPEVPSSTSERPWQTHSLYAVSRYIWIYSPPIILLLGVFGNLMTIVIMRRIKSDESTIHIYFSAVAIADTCFLCIKTLDLWLDIRFGSALKNTHDVFCKLTTWLYAGGGTISCWYLVCMTVHRAMSVVWPHRVNAVCTRHTVLRLMAGITVFNAALYSHYLAGFELVYTDSRKRYLCTIRPDNYGYIYFVESIFVYIELLVYCVVPFIVLVVSNSVLVWTLILSVKLASRHLTEGDSKQTHKKNSANSVTLTVTVVSMAFLVLTLPSSINFILNFFTLSHGGVTGLAMATAYFVNALTNMLGDTNHAVNFYLYCLTGRRFREEFLKVVCCRRNRR